MNAPARFQQLADYASLDRRALADLDDHIGTLQANIKAEQEELATQLANRQTLATDLEVSESMLNHAARSYQIAAAQPAPPAQPPPPPSNGVLPTEAEARAHYKDDPTTTQALPAIQTGNGVEVTVTNPDGKADEQQLLTVRRGRKVAGNG